MVLFNVTFSGILKSINATGSWGAELTPTRARDVKIIRRTHIWQVVSTPEIQPRSPHSGRAYRDFLPLWKCDRQRRLSGVADAISLSPVQPATYYGLESGDNQSGADPGIFVRGGGGVQPSEKISISQKKKKKTTRGEGGRFSIYSALVRSKSSLAIEIAFKIKEVHIMPPVFSSHPKLIWHGCFSIVKYVSDVTVGGGGGLGVLPQNFFWFKWCQIV